MDIKNAIADSDLEALRAAIAGQVFVPGQAGYDQARQASNLAVDQRPSLVVAAESVADVVQAVRYARAHGMRIARKERVMAPRRSNRWRAAQLAAGFRPNRGGLVPGRSVPATAQLGRADLQRRSVPAHAARRRLRAGREPALLAEDIAESVASLR